MSGKIINHIKGMPDLLPSKKDAKSATDKAQSSDKIPATPLWQFVEEHIRALMQEYAYEEIRTPVVEDTSLFKRGIGEVTDIVEKEMYTFNRGEQSLTLRPEGTASCVRACIEHSLIRNGQHQRLWYMGPMFRAEEPQQGRYRQFYQLGVEFFGVSSPEADAEQIIIMHELWKRFGIAKFIKLEINSLGSLEARNNYKKKLVEYFTSNIDKIDDDSKRRLKINPLRILDSKNEKMQELIKNAPTLLDNLDEDSKAHFVEFKQILDSVGINYIVNPKIVRGLDYYSRTVYEWTTDELGSQSAVCAGGRYDGLVTQLGGQENPAVGFAMGIERLLLLVEKVNTINKKLDAYFITQGEIATKQKLKLAGNIRDKCKNIKMLTHFGGGNFKKQFKKADNSQADIVLIIGDDEIANNTVSIKYLREDKPQQTVSLDELANYIGGKV